MGFRFRRSIRLLPGLRINLGKKGASVSLGGRGATVNLSSKGTRTTVGLPGTGLSYTHYERRPPAAPDEAVAVPSESSAASVPVGPFRARLQLIGALVSVVWTIFLLVLRVAFLVFVAALVIAVILSLFRH